MNFSSISEDINLTKDLTEMDLIEIIEKFIIYFHKLEHLNPIKVQLTKNQCNGLLFAGTLYDSLSDLAQEHALNYSLIVKHEIENYEIDGNLHKLQVIETLKAKGGGLNCVTEFILVSKNGSEYLNEIRSQYKKYSTKDNYVNTIKSVYANVIDNFTVHNFVKSNRATICDSNYLSAQFLVQSVYEEACLGPEYDTNRINICLDAILKLETNVTLDQYFSVLANYKLDGTQLSLYFVNFLVHVIRKYDTMEYHRFWEMFLRDRIYNREFMDIFYNCLGIQVLTNGWNQFLENYLKHVELFEGNVAGIAADVNNDYQLFTKIMFKDVARLCFLLGSKRNTLRLKFLDNLKSLCSDSVYRILCLKMLNYKK